MASIGQRVKRVRLEQAVQTTNSHGAKVVTWALRAVVWAHERPLSGREAIQAQQVQATLTSVWEIAYRSGLSVKDRLVYGSRTLQIEAIVDPFDTRKELHLMCSEVQL